MVHISQPDALDLLACMEGSQWRSTQDARAADPYGFHFWKRAWDAKASAGLGGLPIPLTTFGERATRAPIIYGAHPYHQYYVDAAGELILMPDRVMPDAAERASALGFRTRM